MYFAFYIYYLHFYIFLSHVLLELQLELELLTRLEPNSMVLDSPISWATIEQNALSEPLTSNRTYI